MSNLSYCHIFYKRDFPYICWDIKKVVCCGFVAFGKGLRLLIIILLSVDRMQIIFASWQTKFIPEVKKEKYNKITLIHKNNTSIFYTDWRHCCCWVNRGIYHHALLYLIPFPHAVNFFCKQCWKCRNCSLWEISPFSTMFSTLFNNYTLVKYVDPIFYTFLF